MESYAIVSNNKDMEEDGILPIEGHPKSQSDPTRTASY
jgi:hypothetical protein